MDLRKLIREEVARSIPYEHKLEALRDSSFKSSFHLGSKAISAKEMGLSDKKLRIDPVVNAPSPEYYERIGMSHRTEREKDYDRFMENRRYGADGKFVPSTVEPAPRMDIVLYGMMLKEFKVNKIFNDVHDNFVMHLASERNSMGVSAYSKPNSSRNESKMAKVLNDINELFGTNYYVGISYLKENEEVFVVKAGGKDLTYGQFIDVDKLLADQKRRADQEAQGEPWRELTAPLDKVKVRSITG
jgi:hypothetical protein